MYFARKNVKDGRIHRNLCISNHTGLWRYVCCNQLVSLWDDDEYIPSRMVLKMKETKSRSQIGDISDKK